MLFHSFFEKLEWRHTFFTPQKENGNVSRHSGPIVKQQKLTGCEKSLSWTLAVGTSPYKWHRLMNTEYVREKMS